MQDMSLLACASIVFTNRNELEVWTSFANKFDSFFAKICKSF